MRKKRYLYASLLSSIFFLLFYLLFNFPFLLSLLFTVGIYVAGIFLFKEQDVRSYDPNLIMHYCFLISKLDYYTGLIEEKKVKENIKDITEASEKIITMLEQKPNKVTQVYDGFDYYLPLAIRVVEEYRSLSTNKKLNKEESKFMDQINLCLDGIEREINKLLENMNYTKMLDINSRIQLFKKDNTLVTQELSGGEDHETI